LIEFYMVDTLTNIQAPQVAKTHFRYKRLLTAAVSGLLLRVLYLAHDGTILLLSPERRIVLVLLALRLLLMVHSSFETLEQTPASAQPRYKGWQAGIFPLFFIAPLLVVFWLAAWATDGGLLGSTGYALAASVIMLLLILNVVGLLMKAAEDSQAGHEVIAIQYGAGKFWVDALFYTAYGLVIALGLLALMVVAPDVLEDSIAVGSLAFNVYLMLWVVQGVIWFFSNLIRQAAQESGLKS
jgi:hypothetical protein